MTRAVFAFGVVFATLFASAQEIQVNRQNKTISITADESATADAEVATLTRCSLPSEVCGRGTAFFLHRLST